MPAPRGDRDGNNEESEDGDEGNLTADVQETTAELRQTFAREINKRTLVAPSSPVSKVTLRPKVAKRKKSPVRKTINLSEEDGEEAEGSRAEPSNKKKKNSDEFPEEERPPMFRDN